MRSGGERQKTLVSRVGISYIYNMYYIMQYYDVVYSFKTSEIRTDLGVLNAVII